MPTRKPSRFAGEDTPHRELNDAAMANLAAWVPALPLYRLKAARGGYEAAPTWRPSSSGKSDDERDLNLKIHPKGIRDFGADKGYTPLDLVMVALGCDLDRAFGFLAERLGWSTPTIELHVDTAQPEAEPAPDPDPLIEYATDIPGVLGDIVDWVTATARRPNRVLALGTADHGHRHVDRSPRRRSDTVGYALVRRRHSADRQRQAARPRQRCAAHESGRRRRPHRTEQVLFAIGDDRLARLQAGGAMSAGRDWRFPQGDHKSASVKS